MLTEAAKEARKAYNKAWREKHKERLREYQRVYQADWRAKNKEKAAVYNETYWERKAAAADEQI